MAERESNVPSELAKLDRDIVAFKGTQFIGSNSVRTFTVETSNTWDFTITTASPFYYGQIGVIYESESGTIPSAQLVVKADVDGVAYDPSNRQFTDNPHIFVDFMVLGVYSSDLYTKPGVMVWNVFCQATTAKTYRIKAYVKAAEPGTLRFVDFGI